METIRKLLALQIRENGISQSGYDSLEEKERKLLEEKGGKYYLPAKERRKRGVGLSGWVVDILHAVEIFTLCEAGEKCDFLAVVVASDEHILKKGRKLVHSQEYRATMVEFLKPVDVAISGGKDFSQTLARVNPDVIIYGYDQQQISIPPGVEIVKLEKHIEPEKLKSSKIIKELGL